MIRSILLPFIEGWLPQAASEYALWLARKQGCGIHALAIINVRAFEIPILGTPDGFMPSVMPPPLEHNKSLLDEMTSLAKDRLEAVAGQCSAAGIRCSTDCRTGIPGEVVVNEAVAHDILVMARRGYGRAGAEERVEPLVTTVIRGSMRPVLVCGREFREVRQILIAYDGSVHAVRALQIAAILGSKEETQATLIHVAASEEAAVDILAPASAYLHHHGVTHRRQVVRGTRASEVICELATSTGTDLLVMGAYGHSPIREMIFGSTTEKVLSHCGTSVVLQS